MLHNLCSHKHSMGTIGLQLRLRPKHRRRHRLQPSLLGINGIGIHTINTALAPEIPELLYFAFQLKVRSNHTRTNHRRMRRTNPLQIPPHLHGALVHTHLHANRHWVWNPGGWLRGLGAIDFAGGLVVHISAGLSALAAALVVGRRKGCAVPWKAHMKAIEKKDNAANSNPPTSPTCSWCSIVVVRVVRIQRRKRLSSKRHRSLSARHHKLSSSSRRSQLDAYGLGN